MELVEWDFMGQLFFKKVYQDAIRAGLKWTTIRRWDRPRVQAGRRAFCPGLGWLRIEQVEVIGLKSLTDADAKADGFTKLIELREALLSLYPDHATDGKRWWRVQFDVDAIKPGKLKHPTLFREEN